jgi:hypothetical protein
MAKPKILDAPVATPENTPLPGGGSWHWDDANACWAENTDTSATEPQSVAVSTTPVNLPE